MARRPDWVSCVLEDPFRGVGSPVWSTEAAWQALCAMIKYDKAEATQYNMTLHLPLGEGIETCMQKVAVLHSIRGRREWGSDAAADFGLRSWFPRGLQGGDGGEHFCEGQFWWIQCAIQGRIFMHRHIWSEVNILRHRQFQKEATLGISVEATFQPAERDYKEMKKVIQQLIEADTESLYWSEPQTPWEAAKERGLPDGVCGMLYPPDIHRVLKNVLQRCKRLCILWLAG